MKKKGQIVMEKFKEIIALGLAAMASVSAMSISALATDAIGEQDEGSNAVIMSTSQVFSDNFETALYKGNEEFTSRSFKISKPYAKIWANNMSENEGALYLVQVDAFSEDPTGKELYIERLEANKDNQIEIIQMSGEFGSNYASYRYVLRIEGSRNFHVSGQLAVREGDYRSELTTINDEAEF